MTDGTSQGLFIVVAIVIFGIFVVMAYILFEDTLSPSLASMFTEATEVSTKKVNKNVKLVGSWDYEMDSTKDSWGGNSNSEFMLYGVDLTPIIEEHGIGKYRLTFEAKSSEKGVIRAYVQNGSSARYGWDWDAGEFYATERYSRHSIDVDVKVVNLDVDESLLAFFGMSYESERYPTVKKVRLYKVLE